MPVSPVAVLTSSLGTLDRTKSIVVYCASGYRSRSRRASFAPRGFPMCPICWAATPCGRPLGFQRWSRRRPPERAEGVGSRREERDGRPHLAVRRVPRRGARIGGAARCVAASKARALVKALALAHAHRRHREQLMDELWPALGPAAAAANLRKAIHFARRAVGAERIVVRHELVELAGSDVWVDVDAFEAALPCRRRRHRGCALHRRSAHRGPLRAVGRGAPRELRRELAEALVDVGRERERLEDGRGAVQAFERLVAVDPFHEEAYCGLLRINAAEGHRHLALRWYQQLEDRLREDRGTEPGAGIRRRRDAVIADNGNEGQAMHGAETGPSGSVGGAAREERKLVTVLAAELRTGSPSRSSSSEAGGSLRRAQAAIGAELVEGWGGVHSPVADGFLAVFGLAAAGEADVAHALHTALGLVRGSYRRFGSVDTGVIVAPNEPHRISSASAARRSRSPAVCGGGPPRHRVVSERSWRSARAQFRLPRHTTGARRRDRGRGREVRSVEPSAPIRPWPNVPMVGRSAELNALVALADEVAVRRRPRLVNVVGSVGVGKSRLVAEAVLAVREHRPDFQVGVADFSARRRAPPERARDILRQACSINLGESPTMSSPPPCPPRGPARTACAVRRGRGLHHRGSGRHRRPDQPGRPAHRPGAAGRGRRANPSVGPVRDRIVSTRPAVFLIEDLHWAGDQFVDIIEHLATDVHAPLLVVTTARPELYDRRPGFGHRGDASTIAPRELT